MARQVGRWRRIEGIGNARGVCGGEDDDEVGVLVLGADGVVGAADAGGAEFW